MVDELSAGGHAQQAGITVGDVLLAVTARAQVRSEEGGVNGAVAGWACEWGGGAVNLTAMVAIHCKPWETHTADWHALGLAMCCWQ